MAFKRITENDMLGKGNVGKPDTPGVSTSEMQRIMDELPREVIAPAFNELSGQLEANTASADIGANAPDGITPDPAPAENSPAKLQSVLQGIVNKITDHIADQVKHVTSEERTLWNNASNDRHTHDNKSILDGITSSLVGNWNAAFAHIPDAVRHITENERTNWNDKYTKSETDKAINERVVEIGSSDMTKAVYDPETRNLPYIPKIDAEALTLGKNVVLSGTPVSIAYAGTNRIASITAYGENAQGGTTEAPVALTGVDLVHVCRRNLFPCVETSGVTNGITKTVNTDGSITLSGTATDRVVIFITNRKSHIVLSKGTYTIGIGATIPDGCAIALGHYHGNKYIGGLMVMSAGKSYKSFQVSNITGVLEGYFEIKSGTTVNTTIYPMLNLGSTAMPYEPYQGSVTTLLIPRPLRRVGDVRDVCRTRVKSKWDKSLQVESSKLKKNNANAYQYYINTDTEDVNRTVEPGCNRFTPNYTAGISAFSGGFNFWMKGVLEVDDLEHAKAWFDEHPTKVFYQSTAYDGTNGLDVCLTEYQTGYIESYADESITTAWISSTGELSTGAEVAYVLSSPETYATEPLDFDNAAGPLTVMTGGELEVRMTELIGSRSPELTAKMDKAVYDQVGNPNLLDNSDFTNPVNQRGEGAYYANGYMIDRWVNNGSAYNVAEHYMASGSHDGTKYIFQPLEFSKVAKAGDTLTASANINGETISVTAKITTAKGASDVVSTSDGKASIGFSWNPADDRMYFRINDLIESGAVFLNWAKLEKGSVATPYVPKGYGAELAECMRYYQKIAFSVGQDRSTYKYIPTLIPMRVAPTCTLQQISSSGVQPTISTSNLYITANLVAPQYFDGFAYLSADL